VDELIPGSPEWHAKIAAMLAEEAKQPVQWWYLSFVKDEKFAGACVVQARGVASALQRSHALGINPGGEVMSFPVGAEKGPLPADRLLSRAEMEAFEGPGATVGELKDRGILPGSHVEFHD
jgi:hypothetical protein